MKNGLLCYLTFISAASASTGTTYVDESNEKIIYEHILKNKFTMHREMAIKDFMNSSFLYSARYIQYLLSIPLRKVKKENLM